MYIVMPLRLVWEICNETLFARLRSRYRRGDFRGRDSKPFAEAGRTGLCDDGRAALRSVLNASAQDGRNRPSATHL